MTDIFKGATNNSVFIELVDSTTGLPKTGIVYTDVTGSYVRTRSSRVAITMATLASASASFSSGGFILIDDTNQPGVYRIDVPDAAFATGAVAVVVTVKATGCRTVSRLFSLVDINNQVAYAPNAVAGAANGLFIAGTNAATTVTSAFTTTFTGSLTGSVGSVSGAVGSVTGAVGSVTGNVGGNVNGNVVGSVGSVSGNVGGNVSGNVSGSVGSVAGAVGSVTGSVGSVVGSVGGSVASVAGAVGSVTGNVGGDVSGKVLGGGSGTISGDGVRAASVTGAVGSVTGSVGSVTGAVELDSAVGTQITAIETFATRMTTGLVQDGAVYQFTANMLELGPSGGGGGGSGDATLAKQEEILTQLDVIQTKTDQIGSVGAITSLLAAAVLEPGTITSFPETLTIGDSYTDQNGRSIQIPIVDTDGNPLSSTGSLNFADASVTFTLQRSGETDSTRVITGTASFVDPPGTGTGAGAPYAVVEISSTETAKGLKKYKYSGILTFTWAGTGTDVMSFETDTVVFDN